MELKPGYKQTVVGVIPVEWDVVLLDSVSRRASGHTPDKAHPEYWGGDIKWVSLADSHRLDDHYINETTATITAKGIANSSANILPAGCCIVSRDAGVGKSAVLAEEMAVSQHFMAWHCGPSLNNHYLYFLLQAMKSELERIAIGNTIKTIGLPYFKSLRVPLPSIVEQQSIASALLDVDQLIRELAACIAKKRGIRQAAMQELLTGKRRLPGFEGEWVAGKLGDYVEKIVGGGTPSRANPGFWGGEIPWATVKDLTVFQPNQTQEWLTRDGLKNSSANLIPAGTLIASTRMALGKAVIFATDVAINQDLKAIFFGKNGMARFFCYWFEANASAIDAIGGGSTVKGISLSQLKALDVANPGLAEQNAIVDVISDIETEIETLENRLTKTRALKQAMMQELLTGRIRLR
jgi:type I restriction enzyme S subunit